MMCRESGDSPPSDDQFLTNALSGRFLPRDLLRSTKRRGQVVRARFTQQPRKERTMRRITFGLPARLALLALTIAAAIALAGFPGLSSKSSVATAAGGA